MTLLNKIKNISSSFIEQNKTTINKALDKNANTLILNATIDYLIFKKGSDGSIFT